MVGFSKERRCTFKYWFAHWCAFNMTALNYNCWRPRFLLHDIEKPWLKLIWGYEKTTEWHRKHNKHHLGNKKGKFDGLAMAIDWECARFTKKAKEMDCMQTLLCFVGTQVEGAALAYSDYKNIDKFFAMYPGLKDELEYYMKAYGFWRNPEDLNIREIRLIDEYIADILGDDFYKKQLKN